MRFEDFVTVDGKKYNGKGEEASELTSLVNPSSKDAELIRKSIVEEMEAVNDYIKRAEMCENEAVRKLFLDIAREERVHFGEFEEMLEAVDLLHEPSEEEAEEELEDMFNVEV